MAIKLNHICANSKCMKRYYACDYCDRTSYLRIACSPECYAVVVTEAKKNNVVNRIDKTKEEIEITLKKPLDEVYKESVNEISEVIPDVENMGIEQAVQIINESLEKETKPASKKKAKQVKK